MANFDFSSLATTSGVASSHKLRPFDIYNVKFEEAKLDQVEAKVGVNAGKVFDVLKVRFSGDEGFYEESIFLPIMDSQAERQANNWGGLQPSEFDKLKMFVAHTCKVINPAGFAAFQQALASGKSIEGDCKTVSKKLAEVCVNILNKNKGKKVALKLAGYKDKNGTVRASLPYYTAINQKGVEYVNNNFLADLEVEKPETLSFTASEMKKKAEFENMKPTEMPANPADTLDITSDTKTVPSEDNSDLLNLIDSGI